jgi:hypothetical protein
VCATPTGALDAIARLQCPLASKLREMTLLFTPSPRWVRFGPAAMETRKPFDVAASAPLFTLDGPGEAPHRHQFLQAFPA